MSNDIESIQNHFNLFVFLGHTYFIYKKNTFKNATIRRK